jgi:hypothetical protein
MTASAGYYNEIDAIEGFDNFEMTNEVVRDHRTGAVRVPGGLISATLNTPKGPAKLNLPAPVSTLAQFRTLEQVVNTNNQRVNAQLAQLSRQVAARSQQGIGGIGMMPLLIGLMAKKRFDTHVHEDKGQGKPAAAADAGDSGFSAFLPFLLLQPGLLGGQGGSGVSAPGGQDGMSPLLMMLLVTEILK